MKSNLIALMLMVVACAPKKTEQEIVNKAYDSAVTVTEMDSTETNDYESLFRLETYLTSPKADTATVQVISEPVALIIVPTTEQAAAMEKEFGEDFYTIADDASYYQSIAIGMIDSLGIKSVNATKPFISFKGTDTNYTLDIRRDGLPEWNIIFLHPEKQPQIVQAIQLTEEHIKSYFNLE